MFTSFSEGADHPGDWNGARRLAAVASHVQLGSLTVPRLLDEAAYLPGRFKAHARPTSPAVNGPVTPDVPDYGLRALAADNHSEAPPFVPNRATKRARALERTLDALSPDRRRRREAEDERESLLGPWLAREGSAAKLPAPFVPPHRSTAPSASTRPPSARALTHPAPTALLESYEDDDDRGLLRPGRRKVDNWMSSWWRRWAVLVGTPCILVSRT